MLDALASLARRRGVQVAVALVVAVAVVGPWLVGDGGERVADTLAPTSTTTTARGGEPGPETTAVPDPGPSTSTSPSAPAPPASSPAEAPPTSAVPEVDRDGDDPNPGGLHPGRPDIRPDDQERAVGGPEPARISGFSAWVDQAGRRDAGPDGAPGAWVRVVVRVLNRDTGPQRYTYEDWTLVAPDGTTRRATQASADFTSGADLPGHALVAGELWFPLTAEGDHWLLYRPQQDRARGVWAVPLGPAVGDG